jgi:23S rRNA pseudouridine955/2504/2580 synthase
MKNIFEIEETFNNMRLDRWIRNKFGSVPQGLIEKNLRNGNIKINKKRAKSSFKVKTNDKIYVFNFNFQNKLVQKKLNLNLLMKLSKRMKI